MKKPVPEGSTYIDKINLYVMEKRNGLWRAQHIWRMEEKIGRHLAPNEEVHHRDEDRSNNADHNLELMTKAQHRAHHHRGKKHSPETRAKMSKAALRVGADPAERQRRSERARRQHADRRFNPTRACPLPGAAI